MGGARPRQAVWGDFDPSLVGDDQKSEAPRENSQIKGYQTWLKQVIEERIRLEEDILTELKERLRSEP